MTTPSSGLRAMKKRQTRENISDQATRLFLERGFDNVTIAEVAAAAQVAKMTVTNYFPRKEDLALDMHDMFVQAPVKTMRERKPRETALFALRRTQLAAVAEHDPVIGFSGPEFARMITDSVALTARLREFHDARERALAVVFAEETGAAPDDITPRVAAAAMCGVLRLLFEETMRRTLDGEDNADIARVVTELTKDAFAAIAPSYLCYAPRLE